MANGSSFFQRNQRVKAIGYRSYNEQRRFRSEVRGILSDNADIDLGNSKEEIASIDRLGLDFKKVRQSKGTGRYTADDIFAMVRDVMDDLGYGGLSDQEIWSIIRDFYPRSR